MSKEIASLNADDSIGRATQLMKQYDVGSIPECSQKKVIGIVIDRDIVLISKAEGQTSKPQKIRDISVEPILQDNAEEALKEISHSSNNHM